MFRFLRLLSILFVFLFAPPRARPEPASKLAVPPGTSLILEHIYSGRRDLALPEIRQLQQHAAENPLGYLLEAENQWWKIWCGAAEFKYGMTMARHRDKLPADQQYLDLTTKAYSLAEVSLRQHDSAEMRLYAAMADALAARLYSLRGEYRATARVGVRARENFLAALALDPSLADADTGLGLYNYYVSTLSTLAKVLRFFMGIPGGSKEEGIRQLQHAIQEGQLSPPMARFYLAINLLNYDQRYEEALQVVGPLVEKYPGNSMFRLLKGDLYARLGRKQLAEASYGAAEAAAPQVPEAECQAKIKQLVGDSLRALKSK
jgi:predicted negative regulator of RcsB-dependent stress response